jgi:uncharacterized phage-associated protein
MTISTFEAAKTLGHYEGWSLSNLRMQKVLYLAHMFYMGQNEGEPLVGELFQSWDLGPILPSLYKKVSFFGSDAVQDVFYGVSMTEEGPEAKVLKLAAEGISKYRHGALVSYTHKEGGAWSNNYVVGANGRTIPNKDILEEYQRFYA